ncbi:MAG TPA: cytidine deaminase [Polyangiaceae bacterium]|jgi:cytidine deaminase|nr:cytidine deaminase [Polyangiaceae bacterium]
MTSPDETRVQALLEAARQVRENAYAPYSGFRVGAALLTDGGNVYTGCNVENASYGATICAERAAIFRMVASGETRPVALAIFVDDADPAMPCGMCRQVISEFGRDVLVVTATPDRTKRSTIEALLPDAFVLRK